MLCEGTAKRNEPAAIITTAKVGTNADLFPEVLGLYVWTEDGVCGGCFAKDGAR